MEKNIVATSQMPEGINIKHLKLSDLKTVQQTEYYYNYLQIIFPTFVINIFFTHSYSPL